MLQKEIKTQLENLFEIYQDQLEDEQITQSIKTINAIRALLKESQKVAAQENISVYAIVPEELWNEL